MMRDNDDQNDDSDNNGHYSNCKEAVGERPMTKKLEKQQSIYLLFRFQACMVEVLPKVA